LRLSEILTNYATTPIRPPQGTVPQRSPSPVSWNRSSRLAGQIARRHVGCSCRYGDCVRPMPYAAGTEEACALTQAPHPDSRIARAGAVQRGIGSMSVTRRVVIRVSFILEVPHPGHPAVRVPTVSGRTRNLRNPVQASTWSDTCCIWKTGNTCLKTRAT